MMERNDPSRYDDGRGAAESGSRGPSGTLIVLIVVAVAALIFVLKNSERATIDFVFSDVDTRVWVVIAISIAIGVVLDRLILLWWRRSRRHG